MRQNMENALEIQKASVASAELAYAVFGSGKRRTTKRNTMLCGRLLEWRWG